MRDFWQQGPTRDASQFSFSRGMFGGLVLAGWLMSGSQAAFAQETGEQIFQKICSVCHSIGAGRIVGPDLKGVNDRRTEEWLLKFVKASGKVVSSGDATAVALVKEYQIPMPDQPLSDDQIRSVLAHIKAASSAAPAAAAPQPAPVVEASPDEILLGQQLFEGKVRLANGGPSCNACHHVQNDALLGGGILARELTLVFSRLGRQGVSAILGNTPFPVMQAAYAGKGFSEQEVNALVGFLQQVDKEQARQMPRQWGWRMFSAGAAGVVVLLAVFMLAGRRRKKGSVNQSIYDRQVKSE